jgi:hypothetical protein
MDTIQKGLAGIFAVLFVLTALAALMLFNLERHAFAALTYQQAFANDNFYERLPATLVQALTTPTQQTSLPLSMRGLTAQNWETFIRALLPPEALKQLGDQALTSIFSYLNDEADTAVISLAPIKTSMASEAGVQAVLEFLKTQPECTLAQIQQMAAAVLNGQETSLCNPPENLLGVMSPLIQAQLQVAAAAIPDQITLAQVDPALPKKDDPRERIKLLRLILRLSPLLPLFFLFTMTILAVRSLRDWLAWWGIPFLVTGISAIAMAWLGAPLTGLILLRVLVSKAPGYLPSILLNNGSQLATAVLDQLLKPVMVQGIVLMFCGFVMTALAFIAHRMWKRKEQTASLK